MTNAYPLVFIIGTLASFLWLGLTSPSDSNASGDQHQVGTRITHIDAGLIALLSGLTGARVSFVLLHWDHYVNEPAEIFWFWQGGLTWVGGALAAILGIAIYASRTDRSFWSLIDALAIPGSLIALSAWLGCYLDGCAFGMKMPESFWTPRVEDMFGGVASRWPTQTAGILSSGMILLVLYWLTDRRLKRGIIGLLSLSMIAGDSLALSFTRSDPAMLIHGYRLGTIGSAVTLLLALSGLLSRLKNE